MNDFADDNMKTEPGFIITVSLTAKQREDIDRIKDQRKTATGARPGVRELVEEAIKTFIDRELKK